MARDAMPDPFVTPSKMLTLSRVTFNLPLLNDKLKFVGQFVASHRQAEACRTFITQMGYNLAEAIKSKSGTQPSEFSGFSEGRQRTTAYR
jgi:hypothetical protein